MTERKAASRLTVGKVRQRAEILEALEGLQRLGAVTNEEVRHAKRRLHASTQGEETAELAPPVASPEGDRLVIK
jgi:hypothetical protein